MTLVNGHDDGPLLVEEDAGEWRARLAELRELRQSHLYELELLTKTYAKPSDGVAQLISIHGDQAEALSQQIALLLRDAAEAADDA